MAPAQALAPSLGPSRSVSVALPLPDPGDGGTFVGVVGPGTYAAASGAGAAVAVAATGAVVTIGQPLVLEPSQLPCSGTSWRTAVTVAAPQPPLASLRSSVNLYAHAAPHALPVAALPPPRAGGSIFGSNVRRSISAGSSALSRDSSPVGVAVWTSSVPSRLATPRTDVPQAGTPRAVTPRTVSPVVGAEFLAPLGDVRPWAWSRTLPSAPGYHHLIAPAVTTCAGATASVRALSPVVANDAAGGTSAGLHVTTGVGQLMRRSGAPPPRSTGSCLPDSLVSGGATSSTAPASGSPSYCGSESRREITTDSSCGSAAPQDTAAAAPPKRARSCSVCSSASAVGRLVARATSLDAPQSRNARRFCDVVADDADKDAALAAALLGASAASLGRSPGRVRSISGRRARGASAVAVAAECGTAAEFAANRSSRRARHLDCDRALTEDSECYVRRRGYTVDCGDGGRFRHATGSTREEKESYDMQDDKTVVACRRSAEDIACYEDLYRDGERRQRRWLARFAEKRRREEEEVRRQVSSVHGTRAFDRSSFERWYRETMSRHLDAEESRCEKRLAESRRRLRSEMETCSFSPRVTSEVERRRRSPSGSPGRGALRGQVALRGVAGNRDCDALGGGRFKFAEAASCADAASSAYGNRRDDPTLLQAAQIELIETLRRLDEQEQELHAEIELTAERTLGERLAEGRRRVEVFAETPAGRELVVERARAYAELNTDMSEDAARREAREDLMLAGETRVRRRIAEEVQRQMCDDVQRIDVERLKVAHELVQLQKRHLAGCDAKICASPRSSS
eukprot:TRINITY_DN16811_c0_g1_i1.p1 TRINITY_DN16811_c0_g1~~TRINITY_DN16811_c0_g1_i1.p1  ORF type:complete len:801 (-),score=130.10 TRINITY_DN16811_c0_g1_i1:106-2508(-)